MMRPMRDSWGQLNISKFGCIVSKGAKILTAVTFPTIREWISTFLNHE